jgi:hypothetical protein
MHELDSPLPVRESVNAPEQPTTELVAPIPVAEQTVTTPSAPQPPIEHERGIAILQARNIASKEGILQVMRDGLRNPYPEGSLKGPLVTVTTRLPDEICQRLEWASSITGQKKQEVITEALRLYFERLASEED